MPPNSERQRFRNADLVLQVSPNVNRSTWDESRYEAFIDELCGDREYQKEALRTALRYLLGGEYADLRTLARAEYERNPVLAERYGPWAGLERRLQFPDQLSASLDLATATGKSYVLYGLAAVMLAEGAVDRVLVLCPSTTIEIGLLEKFGELAGDGNLRDLLHPRARIAAPQVITAGQSITEGSICVENYHAILQHVGSSIRDSLMGKGARTLVLNDEAHHVANEPASKAKKWKEFLTHPDYGFRYILGVSGTCYVKDDYFADVVYRYSLRQAMEERYAKQVEYVAEMPRTSDPDDVWQLIRNHHEEIKRRLKKCDLLPLTIIVTATIQKCKDVADELKEFLVDHTGLAPEAADEQVLVVYNGAPDVPRLRTVDNPGSKAEWIVAVSMLNEGWDVKRVFQIVPHEERAFNSKLLIAQVLGRGLRVPAGWQGSQPEVTVFNHEAWAPQIRHLVNEVLEMEKRLSSYSLEDSPYHFELHNIEYRWEPSGIKKPMDREYDYFAKGYVDLATDYAVEDVAIEFERAVSEDQYQWQTQIQHRPYTPRQIAVVMYERFQEAQDPDDPDPAMRTVYTDRFPVERLEKIVTDSLARINATVATERMKQTFLQSLGTLSRKTSEYVRYTPSPTRFYLISTQERQSDSVSAAELKRDKTIFVTDRTRATLQDEQVEFFDQVAEQDSGFRRYWVQNVYDFKTPLNAAIADSQNERQFIRMLLEPANLPHCDAWIKSTAVRFYEIEYFWKKGEHPKRGKFSPDFFIKTGNLILVVEIKGDEELAEPAQENRKKNEYAATHFKRVKERLEQAGSPIRYKFNFLTPQNFNRYFQSLREGHIEDFRSDLDVKLAEE